MARATGTRHKRHKKVLDRAKGYRAAGGRRFKAAKEAVLHAGQYAYIGRKLRKRDIHRLWVQRLNAAVREHDLSYSKFISGLKTAKIGLNRKMLADIAARDTETFKKIVEKAKA